MIVIAIAVAVVGILALFGVLDEEEAAPEVVEPPIFVLPPESTLPPETTTTTEAETTAAPTTTTTAAPSTTTTAPTTTTTAQSTTTTVGSATTTTTAATTTSTQATTTTTQPPAATTTVVGVLPTIPVAPPDAVAAIETFIDEFNQAVAAGDTEWLFDQLNPLVVQSYGEAACRSTVETRVIKVIDLALAGPVIGPTGTTVGIPVEGGGQVAVTLEDLYSADVSFSWNGSPVVGLAWFQIATPAGGPVPVTYFTKCQAPAPTPR